MQKKDLLPTTMLMIDDNMPTPLIGLASILDIMILPISILGCGIRDIHLMRRD